MTEILYTGAGRRRFADMAGNITTITVPANLMATRKVMVGKPPSPRPEKSEPGAAEKTKPETSSPVKKPYVNVDERLSAHLAKKRADSEDSNHGVPKTGPGKVEFMTSSLDVSEVPVMTAGAAQNEIAKSLQTAKLQTTKTTQWMYSGRIQIVCTAIADGDVPILAPGDVLEIADDPEDGTPAYSYAVREPFCYACDKPINWAGNPSEEHRAVKYLVDGNRAVHIEHRYHFSEKCWPKYQAEKNLPNLTCNWCRRTWRAGGGEGPTPSDWADSEFRYHRGCFEEMRTRK